MVSTRPELIEAIKAAFRGVSREGGVSWSETDVIDDYGTEEMRAIARASDTDSEWEELILSGTFLDDAAPGSFCFLDAIGFRYYLPAAMCQALMPELDTQGRFFGWHGSLIYHLIEADRSIFREGFLLLSKEQKRVIANFITYNEAEMLFNLGVKEPRDFDELFPEGRQHYISQAVIANREGPFSCWFPKTEAQI
ncbi:MAG: DUF6714 family protein [Armatimonadota bacterium]